MSSNAIVALLLLVMGVTFWRPLRRVRAAQGLVYLASTGHLFLAIGYLIGLAIEPGLAQQITRDLGPVVSFIAAWVGFAVGMRFDLRLLRLVPRRAYALALFPAVSAATAVGAASFVALWSVGAGSTASAAGALILAAAASTSGPTLPAALRRRRVGRDIDAKSALRMMEFSAGLDDVLVVILSLVAFTLFRPQVEAVPPMVLLASTVSLGAILGLVTWLFLGGSARDDERLLLGLAVLAFAAGFGGWLLLSPAALLAVTGFVLVNLPGRRSELLLNVVAKVERPAVVILMTVVGVHIAGHLSVLFAVLLGLVLVLRLLAKLMAGRLTTDRIDGAPGAMMATPGWTLGLVSQGNLGLVVALSLFHVWQDDASLAVLAAIAVGSLINEMLAPPLLARALTASADAGRERRALS